MGLLAATALSLAAAACGTPSAAPPRTALAAGEPASAAQAPQPVSVKLAINKIGAMTNTWVAQQNGIFAKHSLSVEMMEPSKTGDNIAALQARSVDMALQILGAEGRPRPNR